MKSTAGYHVMVVGAGGIGIRHVEGLLKTAEPLSITVVDPSDEARQKAHDLASNAPQHRLTTTPEIQRSDTVDLAIVATSAKVRAALIRALLERTKNVRYLLLEKILFTGERDYADIATLLEKRKIAAWVNCPLRLMPVRKDLRQRIGGKPFSIHFNGGLQHGLMTNCMHYADYASFLSGGSPFEVDTSMLSPEVFESKRSGYKELAGTLALRFENGSQALFTSLPSIRPRRTIVSAPSVRAVLEEVPPKAFIAGWETGWRWQTIDAPFTFQSDMTGPIVRSILERGSCELPTFAESTTLHLSPLRSVRDFLSTHGHSFDVDFPFT